MYYNPDTKEIKNLDELKILFNASIPFGIEEINEWYLVHDENIVPNTDEELVKDEIKFINGYWTQTYKLEKKSEIEKIASQKEMRDNKVNSIKITVDGMIFDGDEKSQERITRVILNHQDEPNYTLKWVLSNNTLADVTIAQLKEVLYNAMEEQSNIWIERFEE